MACFCNDVQYNNDTENCESPGGGLVEVVGEEDTGFSTYMSHPEFMNLL